MPTLKDLSPFGSLGESGGPTLIAVGWLGIGEEYDRGLVDSETLSRLKTLVSRRFEPAVAAGPHFCELCPERGPGGAGNLWVPTTDRIFVCPELILHYIVAHEYRPPDEFIRAAIECPDPQSEAYRALFLQAGGGALLS